MNELNIHKLIKLNIIIITKICIGFSNKSSLAAWLPGNKKQYSITTNGKAVNNAFFNDQLSYDKWKYAAKTKNMLPKYINTYGFKFFKFINIYINVI